MAAQPDGLGQLELERGGGSAFAGDDLFTRAVRDYAAAVGHVEILEAGCGREWTLDLPDVDYRLTGVDIDAEALRFRHEVQGDLDATIVGDLRTVDIPDGSFDVIFNSFVLEHVSGARQVLDRFERWLKPGGLLLLRMPDRDTVWGAATRMTPFRLHVLYKRWVRREPDAGTVGHGPYPTVYDEVVSRRGIHRYCQERGLAVRAELGSNYHLKFFGPLAPVVGGALKGAELLSLGRLQADHANLALVISKPSSAPLG